MRIMKVEHKHYDEPIPVYDVVDAKPNHNFFIAVGDRQIVSHNCGFL